MVDKNRKYIFSAGLNLYFSNLEVEDDVIIMALILGIGFNLNR
jgi:hypothetical protein